MTRHSIIRIAWAVLLMLLSAGSASLAAQDTQPPPGFETMKVGDPSSTESLPATPLVYGAYAAVWLVLLAYLYLLWRRASRVDAALRELQSRVTTTRR